MKKHLILFAAVVLAMSLAFVSCDKTEDNDKPNTPEQPEPNNEPDYTHFNIVPYTWTITQIQNDGLNEYISNMINQALASGSLHVSFEGETGGLETQYAGWQMHVAYNTTNVLNFNVDSYSPQTQQIVITNSFNYRRHRKSIYERGHHSCQLGAGFHNNGLDSKSGE